MRKVIAPQAFLIILAVTVTRVSGYRSDSLHSDTNSSAFLGFPPPESSGDLVNGSLSPNSSNINLSIKSRETDGNPTKNDVTKQLETFINTTVGNHTAMELTGVRQNSQQDFDTMKTACLFNTTAGILAVLLFSLLRKLAPAVYTRPASTTTSRFLTGSGSSSSTDRADPTTGDSNTEISELENQQATLSSSINWLRDTIGLKGEDVIERAGLDGLMLLELFRLGQQIAIFVGGALAIVLCPMHYYLHPLQEAAGILVRVSIDALNPVSGTDYHPLLVWVHVFGVWYVVLVTSWLTYRAHNHFLKLRFAWLKALPTPRATTLLVENIPDELCSDTALKDYFVKLYSEEAVVRAYVVRCTAQLRTLICNVESAAYELHSAEATWERSGNDPNRRPRCGGFLCFGGSKDAIETYSKQLFEAKEAEAAERKAVEEALERKDPGVSSHAAFVTFSSRRSCMLACRQQYRADASELTVTMPPDPADVEYEDLEIDAAHQEGGNLTAGVLLGLIFVMWLPAAVTVSSLTDLKAVEHLVPGLDKFGTEHPDVRRFVEGVLATFVLKVFAAFLPPMLMAIATSVTVLKAGRWSQLKFMGWYFSFQVIFVLLVTSVGQSLVASISLILSRPKSIVYLLAGSLPSASNFYINYIMLSSLLDVMELLRLPQLLKYLFHRFWCHEDPVKAREFSEPENQNSNGTGARMARACLLLVTALVFCSCCPLIMGVFWLHCAVAPISYGYLLVFAETPKPDSGGCFFVEGLRYVFLGLFIYILLMVGILKRSSQDQLPVAMAGFSLFALLCCYNRFSQLIWQDLPFEAIAKVDFDEDPQPGMELNSAACIEYIQPELRVDMPSEGAALSHKLRH
eukprot:TRINITY_DN22261_c5_g1_i1.p1 TRINITY_DN22261_c5_g1~~TRINITY_DN22261_c5_g1_i1.p1  ORF type:complete len:857 (-),score=138.07 TRINITY_DN22261_c5_g1_i1:83-2653(-)